METINALTPVLTLLIPLLGVVPIALASKRYPNFREACTFLVGGALLVSVASMLIPLSKGYMPTYELVEILPDLPIAFRVDPMGLLFALVASSLWILTTLFSIGYMRGRGQKSQTRFYCFFSLSLFATIGVAFSANLLTLYLFYEALSLATLPLVMHDQNEESKIAGRTYLTNLIGTSLLFLLPAMIFIYFQSGTLTFNPAGMINPETPTAVQTVLLLLLCYGFAKAALMPFHTWLPAAMVAPTPVSALLHAVAVVKVGVFSVIRVITEVFGLDMLESLTVDSFSGAAIISWIAAITLFVSSLMAFGQDKLKRVLAFSTIGQLAYIVLAVSVLAPKALTAAIVHIAFHAFGKITLFFCAGAFYVGTHVKTISGLAGVWRLMPITTMAFVIGAFSVIGLPPTAGFLSKWLLVLGLIAEEHPVLLIVVLSSSLLKAGYFFPIIFTFIFKKPSESLELGDSTLWPCVLPLAITALLSIGFFFYSDPFMWLAEEAVAFITRSK